MKDELKKVIDKIARLRALAQSDNLNEAQNAAAAAERLVQEYRLSEADLAEETDEGPAEETDPLTNDTQMVTWKWRLASSLGALYGVALFYSRGLREEKLDVWPYKKRVHTIPLKLVGRKGDVEIMRFQYAYLSLEIERLTQAFGKANKFARGESRTAMNSYRLGAVSGVTGAMHAAKKQAMQESISPAGGAAMVLVTRAQESEALKKRLHPDLRSAGNSGRSNLDGDAFQAGKQAGAGIHSRGSLTAGGHKMLGGGK